MEGGEIIWRQDDESNTPVLSMDESRDIFRDVVSGLDYRKLHCVFPFALTNPSLSSLPGNYP
jgi:hypothetical protein